MSPRGQTYLDEVASPTPDTVGSVPPPSADEGGQGTLSADPSTHGPVPLSRDQWDRQMFRLPNRHVSSTNKLVARDLWAEFQSRQERGVAGRRTILIGDLKNDDGTVREPGRASNVGIGTKAYGNSLKDLQKLGVITLEPGRSKNGKNVVRVEPTDKFWLPSTWQRDKPRNYGHHRKGVCPECGCEDLVTKEHANEQVLVCEGCGVILIDSTNISVEVAAVQSDRADTERCKTELHSNDQMTLDTHIGSALSNQVDVYENTYNQLGGGESSHSEEIQLLHDMAGISPRHIELRKKSGATGKYVERPNKRFPKPAPVTAQMVIKHLEGSLCLGADLYHPNGMTRSLCYDADDAISAALLRDRIGRSIALSDAYVFWEESPSQVHLAGGHLWIVFEDLVKACDAHATAISLAPELANFEYWPSRSCVRLPGGFYKHEAVAEWCPLWLLSPETGELWKRATGTEAIHLMLEWQTPTKWVTEEAVGHAEQAIHLRSGFDGLDCSPVPDSFVRLVPEALSDPEWLAKYRDKARTMWFAITDRQAVTLFNATHRVEEILPPRENGYGLAEWRGERTASVRLYPSSNSWADFGAHDPKENGKHDGGDAFELYCRVHELDRATGLKIYVSHLIQEARTNLQTAAQEGRGPTVWVATVTTPAGWKRYDSLRR